MPYTARTLLSLMPAAFVLPSTIAPTVVPVDGYTITMRITGADAPGLVTFKAAGDRMRVEADVGGLMGGGRGGGGGAMTAGAYILPGQDGKMIMVAPNAPNMSGGTGMAIAMNPGGMMAGRGAPPPAVGDVTVEDLGSGGPILGHATHKYRVKESNGEVIEIWLATDIPGLDYKRFTGAFGANLTGADARMLGKIPEGFPMKVVGQGKNAVTMEVTKLEKTSFRDEEFEVPGGMQVMDLSAMMGGRGRGRGNH